MYQVWCLYNLKFLLPKYLYKIKMERTIEKTIIIIITIIITIIIINIARGTNEQGLRRSRS